MAYVPDSVIDSMSEVTPTAFKIYIYLCRRRNFQTGDCFPSLKRIAKDCHIDYSYASTSRKELVTKGWLAVLDGGLMKPLRGFEESPVTPLENPQGSLENPNIDLDIPNKVLEIPKRIYKKEPTNLTNKKISNSRGCRIPSDFTVTTEMKEWAEARTPTLDPDSETELFINYWEAVSGHRGVKANWQATWRNWMLRAKQYKENKNERGTGQTRKDNHAKLSEYNELFEKYS